MFTVMSKSTDPADDVDRRGGLGGMEGPRDRVGGTGGVIEAFRSPGAGGRRLGGGAGAGSEGPRRLGGGGGVEPERDGACIPVGGTDAGRGGIDLGRGAAEGGRTGEGAGTSALDPEEAEAVSPAATFVSAESPSPLLPSEARSRPSPD